MRRVCCRITALALLALVACACGSKTAEKGKVPGETAAEAGFRLEKDKPVLLRPFGAPASAALSAAGLAAYGGDLLPSLFHDQLIFALHTAGLNAEDAPVKPVVAAPGQGVTVQPLSADPVDPVDPADPVDSSETKSEKTDAVPDKEPGQPPARLGSGYLLSGRITAYHVLAGSSAQVGANAQRRVDADAACVYQVRDAKTGELLSSGAVTGVASKTVTSESDQESVKMDLTRRALAAMAKNMTDRLTGKATAQSAEEAFGDDENQYQDSPGKRLKPKPAAKAK